METKSSAKRDPERTKKEILEAAIDEFADHGPEGGRVDAIAARTNTSKRMIYYYFGSKEGLYLEVLKDAYRRIRTAEVDLGLESIEPYAALQILIRTTLLHFEDNTASLRVIGYENLTDYGHPPRLDEEMLTMNSTAVPIVENILERGRASGVFASHEDAPSALDVHQILSSLAIYRVQHRDTFKAIFGRDMLGIDESAHVRSLIERTVMQLVVNGGKPTSGNVPSLSSVDK